MWNGKVDLLHNVQEILASASVLPNILLEVWTYLSFIFCRLCTDYESDLAAVIAPSNVSGAFMDWLCIDSCYLPRVGWDGCERVLNSSIYENLLAITYQWCNNILGSLPWHIIKPLTAVYSRNSMQGLTMCNQMLSPCVQTTPPGFSALCMYV